MSAATAVWVLLGWAGAVMVLASRPSLQKPDLVTRLGPYVAGDRRRKGHSQGLLSPQSFRDVLGPLCESAASRVLGAAGMATDLQRRLELVHSPESPAELRLRQFAAGCAAVAVTAVVGIAADIAAPVSLAGAAAAGVATVIAIERATVAAAERHRSQLLAELPVIAEQMAMLLAAGHSVPGTLARLAERGSGAASRDLARVCGRIRQGLSTEAALAEWAALADLAALERLASTLGFERDAARIADLVSGEARAIREERQQQLIAEIESRNQKVWIPVTVAALVPGVLFLAVPFIDALEGIAG